MRQRLSLVVAEVSVSFLVSVRTDSDPGGIGRTCRTAGLWGEGIRGKTVVPDRGGCQDDGEPGVAHSVPFKSSEPCGRIRSEYLFCFVGVSENNSVLISFQHDLSVDALGKLTQLPELRLNPAQRHSNPAGEGWKFVSTKIGRPILCLT